MNLTKYPIIILSDQENLEDPGSHWYICFEDGEITRYLPTVKKSGWFQKWKPENCPRVGTLNPEKVLCFEEQPSNYDLTPENISQVFEHKYGTVENYLKIVNQTNEVQVLHQHGVLWDLRNIHGQCGNCGNTFSKTMPDSGDGMCYRCSMVTTRR